MSTTDSKPTPWYGAYGLVGLVLLGVAPILIPLQTEALGASTVGIVVAAFYVGALFTPLAGSFADRTGKQRLMFLTCFPVMSIAMIAFAYAHSTWSWAVLAAIIGGAGAVAGTIGGMFVVEGHPRAEWNVRISWFRMAYGVGQVVGLVVAAVTVTLLTLGWWITAVAVLSGVVLGRIGVPRLTPVAGTDLPPDPASSFRQMGSMSAVLHAFHRPNFAALRSGLHGRFGRFLLVWLITTTGLQTFFNVVPLVMRDAFGVNPSATAVLFMVGAVLGTVLYPVGGRIADKSSPGRVLALGICITIVAFTAMSLMAWLAPSWRGAVGSLALVTAAGANSFEVVGATMLTARLAPSSAGSAMGLLNSVIAAGAILGAIIPSFVAGAFGYPSLTVMATLTLILALVIGKPLFASGGLKPTPGS